MIKEISTMDIRKNLGSILNRVDLKHDQFIIERKGKPMAVIIPYFAFNQIQKEKDLFFSELDEVKNKNQGIPLKTIEDKIKQAVREIRN